MSLFYHMEGFPAPHKVRMSHFYFTQNTLLAAYLVVGVELAVIAALRHRFFGTSWWLSALQVVGGGVLVFAAAWIFGNA